MAYHLKSGVLYSISLKVGYPHQLFGIILHRSFDLFLELIVGSVLPICLFNHLFISGWTHGFFFYTLGYNPILFFLLLSCSSFGHWGLFQITSVSF